MRRDPLALALSSRTDLLALLDIARGYLHDPALGDRRAGDFVDGAASIGVRGPLVATLFAALGDSSRARLWWERVAAASPRHWHYLFELAAAVAEDGDATRAAVHFASAAATSGNAGNISLRAAERLLASGHAVEAIALARQALSLTGNVERPAVYRVLAEAMRKLGRDREAARLPGQTEGTVEVEKATAGVMPDSMIDPGDPTAVLVRTQALAILDRPRAKAALWRAAQWNPDDHRLHGEAATLAAPGSESRDRALAALFALALGPSFEWSQGEVNGPSPRLQALHWDRAHRALRALRAILDPEPAAAWRRLIGHLVRRAGENAAGQ